MEHIVKILVERYRPRTEFKMLHNMMDTLLEHAGEWPIDKTNRWIGFIQGILFVEGVLNIDEERDFTRPLFHAYYESVGIEKPKSVTIPM
jgi:hypothetical protein